MIELLKNEIIEYKTSLEEKDNQIKKYEELNHSLKKKCRATISKLEKKVELIKSLNEEINNYKVQIISKNSEVAQLRNDLKQLTGETELLEQEKKELIDEINNYKKISEEEKIKYKNECDIMVNEAKLLYDTELKTRVELYNKLVELKGNIRVFCRIRPLNGYSRHSLRLAPMNILNDYELNIEIVY